MHPLKCKNNPGPMCILMPLLAEKPHAVTGVLVVFTCLNSKWRIALSSVAWERSMSLGLTSTFQNPPEELKNAWSSGQKQSNFSKLLRRWHFGKAWFSFLNSVMLQFAFCSASEHFELVVCFTLIWFYRFLMYFKDNNKQVCLWNSQLTHCFFHAAPYRLVLAVI